MDGTAFTEVMGIVIPNEITLAQLVTYCVLPTGMELDVDSAFYWHLPRIEDKSEKDKSKWKVEGAVPDKIPHGFTSKVKCSSLHDGSTKQLAHCQFGAVIMHFSLAPDAHLDRLKTRLSAWMESRGQGPDWTVEGPDREAIDFTHEYEVVPSAVEIPIRVFLKQLETTLVPLQSWINISDLLVDKLDLPRGSLFRIFPVEGTVDNRDPVDFAYDLIWEADKQYWYDIVYDPSKDPAGLARQVIMVDPMGRVNYFVIPHNAIPQDIAELWRRVIDAPSDSQIEAVPRSAEVFMWSYGPRPSNISYVIEMTSMRYNVDVFPGTTQYEADQISRLLDIKMPPLIQARKSKLSHVGFKLEYDFDCVPLALHLMAEHIFSWNLEGTILRDIAPMLCWLPYDLNLIMQRGHSVNTAIPEDCAMADFPDLPWGDEVTIMIKSASASSAPQNQRLLEVRLVPHHRRG
jgi:hypothetical protein